MLQNVTCGRRMQNFLHTVLAQTISDSLLNSLLRFFVESLALEDFILLFQKLEYDLQEIVPGVIEVRAPNLIPKLEQVTRKSVLDFRAMDNMLIMFIELLRNDLNMIPQKRKNSTCISCEHAQLIIHIRFVPNCNHVPDVSDPPISRCIDSLLRVPLSIVAEEPCKLASKALHRTG